MVKNNSNIWTEKYRPQNLKEYYYENEEDLVLIKSWIEEFIREVPGTPAMLILSGRPGIGKTTLANLIFKEYNIEPIEINASEERTKKAMHHMLSNITKYRINFSGNKIRTGLILDEIDGVTNSDKGGLQEIIQYIDNYDKVICSNKLKPIVNGVELKKRGRKKKVSSESVFKFPIICTCNSVKNKKIGTLINNNIYIKLKKPTDDYCMKLINRICKSEKLKIKPEDKLKVIGKSGGDYRQIIFNLYNSYLDSKIKKGKTYFGEEDMNQSDEYEDYTIKEDIADNIISRINHLVSSNNISEEYIFYNLQSDYLQYYLNLNSNYAHTIGELNPPLLIKGKVTDVKNKNIINNNFKDNLKKMIKISDNLKVSDMYNETIFSNQDWELNGYAIYIGIFTNIMMYRDLYGKNSSLDKSVDNILDLKYHTDYNMMRNDEYGLKNSLFANIHKNGTDNMIDIYYKIKLEDLNKDVVTGRSNKTTEKNLKREKIFLKIKDKIDGF
jgi:DNA polymerase III delta prime subunit